MTLATHSITDKPVIPLIVRKYFIKSMKIDELNIGPITTPEHPDPSEIRGYIDDEYGLYGFDWVFLEDATWTPVRHCSRTGLHVDDLCLNIGNEFPDADFTRAARYYVLRQLAATIPR